MSDDGRRVLKVMSTQAFFFLSKSFLFDTDTTHMHPRADIHLPSTYTFSTFISLFSALSFSQDSFSNRKKRDEGGPSM